MTELKEYTDEEIKAVVERFNEGLPPDWHYTDEAKLRMMQTFTGAQIVMKLRMRKAAKQVANELRKVIRK